MFDAFFINNLDKTSSSIFKAIKKDEYAYVVKIEGGLNPNYFSKTFMETTSSDNVILHKTSYINIKKLLNKSEALGFNPIDSKAVMFINTLSNYFESKSIISTNAFPVEEGGICLEFNKNDIYYNIEILNDGEVSFYKERANEIPEGWEYSYSDLIQRLNLEFNG